MSKVVKSITFAKGLATACSGATVDLSDQTALSGSSKLIGSSSTTTAVAELTLGTGLSISGTTLSASGGSGTVTSITAGTGLAASPSSPITTSGTLSVSYGSTSTSACVGNDSRLSDARTPTGSAGGDQTGTYPNPTIAASAVTLAKMANMATSSLIYRKTAGSGAPEVNTLATLKTDLALTGTNSGDQTITLTGDVTGSGTGSFATTLASVGSAGTYTSVTTDAKGRVTAGTNPSAVYRFPIQGLNLSYVSSTAIKVSAGFSSDASSSLNVSSTGQSISTLSSGITGMDYYGGNGSVATTSSSGAVVGTMTTFCSSYGSGSGSPALSGTISSSSTTVTGTNTLFLSQLAIMDMIGTDAKGYYRITAIASNTSLTISSTPGSAFSSDTPIQVDSPLIYIDVQSVKRIDKIVDNTHLTTLTNSSTTASGLSWSMGGLFPGDGSNNYFNHVWLVDNGAGISGVVLSCRRTQPLLYLDGYTHIKRLGAVLMDPSGNIINFIQQGNDRRETHLMVSLSFSNCRVLVSGA